MVVTFSSTACAEYARAQIASNEVMVRAGIATAFPERTLLCELRSFVFQTGKGYPSSLVSSRKRS
jgi:hypothetical protein